jgi:hypothetical protein
MAKVRVGHRVMFDLFDLAWGGAKAREHGDDLRHTADIPLAITLGGYLPHAGKAPFGDPMTTYFQISLQKRALGHSGPKSTSW